MIGEEDHRGVQQLLWQRERDEGEMGEQQRGQGEDAAPQICPGEFVGFPFLSPIAFTFVLGEEAESFKTNN